MILAAVIVFAADRVSKYVAVNILTAGESVRVIPNIFHITLVFNSGSAFGLLKNWGVFFIILSSLAIALIVLFAVRSPGISLPLSTALGFILGGAMGNLVDRVKFGYVIDFLDFRVWPVFNAADSAICIGIAMLALSIISKRRDIKCIPSSSK